MVAFLRCWLLLLGPPLLAQAVAFDRKAALVRCNWIIGGEYQRQQHGVPAPDRADVAMCQQALASGDDELRSHACLTIAELAREPFFRALPADVRCELLPPLLTALSSAHPDTAEWSLRAVCALAAPPDLLPPATARAAMMQGLAMALEPDCETRRRAGFLLAAMVGRTAPKDHLMVARTLLLALERYPVTAPTDDRQATARQVLNAVLAKLPMTDATLAEAMAAQFLAVLADTGAGSQRADALAGLAGQFANLRGRQREQSLAALVGSIGAADLQYMTTSGRRTPLRHHGHEALAQCAASLTQAELTDALARMTAARAAAVAAGAEATDVASMYDEALRVLSAGLPKK